MRVLLKAKRILRLTSKESGFHCNRLGSSVVICSSCNLCTIFFLSQIRLEIVIFFKNITQLEMHISSTLTGYYYLFG